MTASLLARARDQLKATGADTMSCFWQGFVHLCIVYALARVCIFWSLHLVILSPVEKPFNFFYSHLFIFSFIPALLVGFVAATQFRSRIIHWVWVVPVVIFLFVLIFDTSSVYPTMFLDSRFREAYHYYFEGNFNFPPGKSREQVSSGLVASADWWRAWGQIHFVVPVYTGIAYSFGACLQYLCTKRS